ncbi:MAG: clostripain-related cysteine peptidase [Bacillota bacterium]|nr:clostripain-related cysteine peptidase [Bacillota bacterium]
MENRPRSREKHVSGTSKGVYRKGSGLNNGPIGKRNGSSNRSGGGGKSPLMILIVALFMIFGGGGSFLSNFMSEEQNTPTINTPINTPTQSVATSTLNVNTNVSKEARSKFTTIKGDNLDQTTLMIYMCGTDLESRSGMATNDLKEIASASSSDQINILIYTGGCTKWQVNGISTQTNQIYQIKDGQLLRLESNMGSKSMTDPNTLTEFIQYGKKNYPANRYDLIFWDHGGGSLTGYGYDQKYPGSSMTLSKIDQALSKAGVKFDFIGFDACLMATAETATMLQDHADYMIASEEVEPGIGWYYTPWINAYVKNPSMSTLSLGKQIIDSYIDKCASTYPSQPTTLSIVDLAEFEAVVPNRLKEWSKATTQLIQNNQYHEIAKARQGTREFNQAKIDQCDFIDLLNKMNTSESKSLASALSSSIKYNRTSRNMSNAYGLSIYFPNKKTSNVNTAAQINSSIGMDNEFNRCLKEYASLQIAGQSVAQANGNLGTPLTSLFGDISTSTSNSDQTAQILSSLLVSLLRDSNMNVDKTADYISTHQLDASKLQWQNKNGNSVISLSEEEWSNVTDVEKNLFVDDGKGYIDLGYDNQFEFDQEGNLIAEKERTWLAINEQPIAYYHATTTDFGDDNYSITGYVPALLNGERVDLLLVFDQDHPYGYVAGSISNYDASQTETVAKVDRELQNGDIIQFLCDYYDYNGNYINSYQLGEKMKISGTPKISDVVIEENSVLTYKFTDIYHQEYWTSALE